MDKGICAVEDCTRTVERREWCKSCYYKLKRRGLVTNLPTVPPLRDRFMDAVKVTPGGCWEWQAARNNLGYGQLTLAGAAGKVVGYASPTEAGKRDCRQCMRIREGGRVRVRDRRKKPTAALAPEESSGVTLF